MEMLYLGSGYIYLSYMPTDKHAPCAWGCLVCRVSKAFGTGKRLASKEQASEQFFFGYKNAQSIMHTF
jgi:hypothetical protein